MLPGRASTPATPAGRRVSTSPTKQVLGLVGWLLVSYAAAAVGSIASAGAGDFYLGLNRPPWAPPAWLFAPVWTGLYLLMGVAAWLVWRAVGIAGAGMAFVLFLLQLGLNALWTWLFFGMRDGTLAFAEILVLWAFILATLIAFWRVRPIAGMLLIPYLLWVTYAGALTLALWHRNPAVLA
jgi:tryptophan-rich sensory protein